MELDKLITKIHFKSQQKMARKTLERANYKGDWPSKTSKHTINSLQLKHVVLALT